jgi:hypothetical protein
MTEELLMRQRLDIETAISVLQTAFSPARCNAKSGNYGKCIEVIILNDAGEQLLPKFELMSSQFSDPSRLALIIANVKENLARTGFVLDA